MFEGAARRGEERLLERLRLVAALQLVRRREAEQPAAVEDADAVGERLGLDEVWKTQEATILLCTHDLREAELLAHRVGILDRGRLLCLEPVDVLNERYGADNLEEAFFAATGRAFEEEDEDAERGVFA